MQISTSHSDVITQVTPLQVEKNNEILSSVKNSKESATLLNKQAFDYFDLGGDLSQHIVRDETQEKTNTELINYLGNLMSGTNEEAKSNLKAFDTSLTSMLFFELPSLESGLEMAKRINLGPLASTPITYEELDSFTVIGGQGEKISGMNRKEVFEFLGDDTEKLIKAFGSVILLEEKFDDRQKEYTYELIGKYNPNPDERKYFDNFQEISRDEHSKIRLNEFKNIYSFSDAFSQTEEFQEYYNLYKDQVSQVKKDASRNGQDLKSHVGAEAFLSSEVIKNSYSKAEVINDYTNTRDTLQNLLDSDKNDPNRTIGKNPLKDIEDSIALYNKMIHDLKDIWEFGDIDIKV